MVGGIEQVVRYDLDSGGSPIGTRLARATSIREAICHTIDAAGESTGIPVTGVYLLTPDGFEHHARGATDETFERYLAVSSQGSGDPLFTYLLQKQTAVHEEMLFTPASWDRHPLFELAAAPAGLRHYMLAPVLGRGGVRGAIAFSRPARDGSFSVPELLTACSLSTHLSFALSLLEARPRLETEQLTAREADVSRLLVKGLTNAEIAGALSISVDYVKKLLKQLQLKLDATNRTELATLLVGYRG